MSVKGSESVRVAHLCKRGESLMCRRVMLEDGCEMSLKTQPSPIFLRLKLCEVRESEEVFGRVRRCDVDMSGDGGLCVCMKV